jgi:hypothetical protein
VKQVGNGGPSNGADVADKLRQCRRLTIHLRKNRHRDKREGRQRQDREKSQRCRSERGVMFPPFTESLKKQACELPYVHNKHLNY